MASDGRGIVRRRSGAFGGDDRIGCLSAIAGTAGRETGQIETEQEKHLLFREWGRYQGGFGANLGPYRTRLARKENLYLTLQLLELGKSMVLALNMMDIISIKSPHYINYGQNAAACRLNSACRYFVLWKKGPRNIQPATLLVHHIK